MTSLPLLKCYPTISELIHDLTGWNIPLPIYSFGFFVALAFVVGAWMLVAELRRKERQGLLQPREERTLVGGPVTPFEWIINAVVGFLIGFKLVGIIGDYSTFSEMPQEYLLSGQGSWLGGIGGAALLAWLKYRDKKRDRLPKPEWRQVMVWPHQRIGDVVTVAAIFGILGARVMVMIETPGGFAEFFADPLGSFFSGLSAYGGLIGGAVAVMIYAHRKGISILHLGDAASPGLVAAFAVGRMGCEVSGDGDWGRVNLADKPGWLSWLPDRLWAYNYPNNVNQVCNPYKGAEATNHTCSWSDTPYLIDPVFPTPIYEIAMAALVLIILWSVRKRLGIPGMLFALYFTLNGLTRFLIEQIRVNDTYPLFGMQMSQAEMVSILLLAGGPIFAALLWRRNRKAG